MGSYATITVNGSEIYSSKSFVEPEAMTLFRETDKKIEYVFDEDNDLEYAKCRYINKIKNIKLRLDIMGFNLKNTEKEFISNNEYKYSRTFKSPDGINDEELSGYSFKAWLVAMEYIIFNKLDIYNLKDKLCNFERNDYPIETYILGEHFDGESYFGFISSDIRFVIRGILELFDEEDEFILDYTDLVNGGYYDEFDQLCNQSIDYLSNSSLTNQKTIIITEGSSDIGIIKRTMKALYPDVLDYYSFMDFNTPKAAGSASSLVNYIKGFIGSGINNKVIALFDNDTAAIDATKKLKSLSIPDNIKILHYPELDIAKDYPTLGPTGTIKTNINGLAGSIELYLGIDILIDNQKNITPIQWKGFNASLNQYQGEIINKEKIMQKYFKLLDDIEKGDFKKSDHDWSGMKKVLELIFKAFD
jgi:HEPN/Toprim N-terminal domain 1